MNNNQQRRNLMFSSSRNGSILSNITFSLFLLSAITSVQAQTALQEGAEAPLQLNGVLYEVIPAESGQPKRTFLWSLELEELTRNYDIAESADTRKRANTLFFQEVSGRDWRQMWGEHVREVYALTPERVNDHAEAFFKINGSFPEMINPGDEFSLEKAGDGATLAYWNDELIARVLKPGHFEFWLRAWHTGVAMPKTFKGNLLAGGFIPDDLRTAYTNSAPPIWNNPTVEQEVSDDQSENTVEQGDKDVIIADSLIPQNVVPVVLESSGGSSDIN